MATPEQIQAVRYEVQDNTPGLYFLDDTTLSYFIDKSNGSIPRASLDAARAILFQLSQRGNETVDIFSFSNSKTAQVFKEALILYIKDPTLNPILTAANTDLVFGGTSVAKNKANTDNSDNVTIQTPGNVIPVKVGYWDFIGY
jgi:hypothetical protein